MAATPGDSATLSSIRTFLLVSLALGILGTAGELLLLGHIESRSQWIPVAMLAAAVPVLAWHAVAPGRASVRTVRVLMALFIVSGIVGVGLHYDGNVEFERELHPTDAGMTLVGHVMTGATPVLAPGSMTLLGLVGLAHAYRHPSAAGGADRRETAL